MPEFVAASIAKLGDLFSGQYRFRLPWFQRAYAWQAAEVGRLLTDLLAATQNQEKAPHYLLGTMVVAKQPGSALTAIVDGHQRTMTLTILFSVLRDLEASAEVKSRLHGLISGPEFHFEPQQSCAEFCRRYVQDHNATSRAFEDDEAQLSETELNILENRNFLREEFSSRGFDAGMRRRLVEYLISRCYVTLHVFCDEGEAWKSLQVEEETRREFSSAESAKASLTSIMPASDRSQCAKVWEECEGLLPAVDLYALLGHMLAVKRRKSSTQPLETEVAKFYKLNKGGIKFMSEELLPCAKRLHALRKGEIGKGNTRREVASSLDRISWIDPQISVPAALHWIEKRQEGGEITAFFNRLERLVWLMRISGLEGPTKRARMFKLLQEIDSGASVNQLQSLQIERSLINEALKSLRSLTFDRKQFARPVLRRISIALGADSGSCCPVECTLEHILPQGKRAASSWRSIFTGKPAKSYSHQLGNLTFLSAKDNHAADNRPWEEKRAIYARSQFVLSKELMELQIWDGPAIDARTERLVRVLLGAWDIQH